jgi:hypothetical protein
MSNKGNEAYKEGYKDGKEGNFISDIAQGCTKGLSWPGVSPGEISAYDAGYEAGTGDRHKTDDKSSAS